MESPFIMEFKVVALGINFCSEKCVLKEASLPPYV